MIVGGHGGVADDGLGGSNSNGSNGGGSGSGANGSDNDDKMTYTGRNAGMGGIYRKKFTGGGFGYESTIGIVPTGPNFIRSEDKIAEEVIDLMNDALNSAGFSDRSESVDITARLLVQDWMNGRPMKTPVEFKDGKNVFTFRFD